MIAVASLLVPTTAAALNPAEVFERVKDSVFVVRAYGADGKLSLIGSGILLPKGELATNCHITNNSSRLEIGRDNRFVSAKLINELREKDVCILSADRLSGGQPVKIGSTKSLRVGAPVYAVGSPSGLELSLSDGIVSQLRGEFPSIIQTTAPISKGSSGGGLFDSDGQLIGLTTLYVKDGQGLNFAVPVEWLPSYDQNPREVTQQPIASEWEVKASELMMQNRSLELLGWSKKWIRAEPKNPRAFSVLGFAHQWLKQTALAIEAYQQVTRLDPNYGAAWENLGLIYAGNKQYQRAVTSFEKAVTLGPIAYPIWASLGYTYQQLNRFPEAADAYRQAIRLGESSPDIASYWYNLGVAYQSMKRHVEAINAYESAIRLSPNIWEYWNAIATEYGKVARYADAKDASIRAIQIDNQRPESWEMLVMVYSAMGNRSASLEALSILRAIDKARADKISKMIGP